MVVDNCHRVVGSCRKVKAVAFVDSYKVKKAAADTPHRVVVLVDSYYAVVGVVVIVVTAELHHKMSVTVDQDCSVDY